MSQNIEVRSNKGYGGLVTVTMEGEFTLSIEEARELADVLMSAAVDAEPVDYSKVDP